MSQNASPPCFEVNAVSARREDGKVVATLELHSSARMSFTLTEEQAVQLVGKLAASLHMEKKEGGK